MRVCVTSIRELPLEVAPPVVLLQQRRELAFVDAPAGISAGLEAQLLRMAGASDLGG